jgi:simple sugar transport system ATP-binding protein
MALLPVNRLRDGAAPSATVAENLTLTTLSKYFAGGRLRRRHEREKVREVLGVFDVRPPDSDCALGTLSGGNQQKVLLARWLAANPALLILDEPTRGIDIGAKAEIEKLVRSLCAEGMSILFISSELAEVIRSSDRIIILRDRHKIAELSSADASEDKIMRLIATAQGEKDSAAA